MIEKLYDQKNRLVGIDIWRGIAILLAIMIHYYHKAYSPILASTGDFFEGYFSIGVVFVGVAGVMGWLRCENKIEKNFADVLIKHWRKAAELILVYVVYLLIVRELRGDQIGGLTKFWLGDPYFMGIFLVLAAVYFLAPFLLWLMKKTGGGWTIGAWAVFWLAAAELLIRWVPIPSFWGDLGYNHWRNTVPILPMLSVYCAGALAGWWYQAGKLTPRWQRLVWAMLILYPLFRYGLTYKDTYINNLFWVREVMLLAAAAAALAYKPKKTLRTGWKWLAFIGSGSFWVFVAGNFQIALLPNKPAMTNWPVIWQWLVLGLIMTISVLVLVVSLSLRKMPGKMTCWSRHLIER